MPRDVVYATQRISAARARPYVPHVDARLAHTAHRAGHARSTPRAPSKPRGPHTTIPDNMDARLGARGRGYLEYATEEL